jgi:hypothetical protein
MNADNHSDIHHAMAQSSVTAAVGEKFSVTSVRISGNISLNILILMSLRGNRRHANLP